MTENTAQIVLRAKNHWMDRALAAEQASNAQREALERIALGVCLGRVDRDEAARIASEALAR